MRSSRMAALAALIAAFSCSKKGDEAGDGAGGTEQSGGPPTGDEAGEEASGEGLPRGWVAVDTQNYALAHPLDWEAMEVNDTGATLLYRPTRENIIVSVEDAGDREALKKELAEVGYEVGDWKEIDRGHHSIAGAGAAGSDAEGMRFQGRFVVAGTLTHFIGYTCQLDVCSDTLLERFMGAYDAKAGAASPTP